MTAVSTAMTASRSTHTDTLTYNPILTAADDSATVLVVSELLLECEGEGWRVLVEGVCERWRVVVVEMRWPFCLVAAILAGLKISVSCELAVASTFTVFGGAAVCWVVLSACDVGGVASE